MTQHQRKRKLIEPRLQLQFAAVFFTTAGLAVLVQMIVVGYMIGEVASELPNDAGVLMTHLPEILRTGFLLTSALLIPLTLVIGIHSTHKVVGPLYRFREFLNRVAAGERPGPCRIRKTDELQDFCALLNRATEPLRAAAGEDARSSERAQAAHGESPPALPRERREQDEARADHPSTGPR